MEESMEDVCKDTCKKSDECDELLGTVAECTDECLDSLQGASEDCEDAVRDVGRCQNGASCSELETGEVCITELFSLITECESLLGLSDECCGEDDACDWADDGFCDCGGAQDWDQADCGG